ncbi:trypsin-like peptidase domain-containing protein [Dactylosporangium cerinum]|uniref:Trypsin-like peptidase domain-containing protein n=1 Tax=Dactylosporangium cerinum TaxID=1434730 RepID=A0ABV9W6K7_9ACTN
MSEQQGWAPNPADEQGRASSPAAQPGTTPADSTTPPAQPATPPVTPPGTAPASPPADATAPAAQPVSPAASAPASADATLPAAQPTAMPLAAMMPAGPVGHEAPHAWPTNPAAPVTAARAGDVRAEPATAWPAAQHATPAAPQPLDTRPAQHAMPAADDLRSAAAQHGMPAADDLRSAAAPHAMPAAQDTRPVVQPGTAAAQDFSSPAPVHTWPASQHAAPQAGPPHPAAQTGNPHPTGPLHGGMHPAGYGQPQPGGGPDPRVWAAAAGAGLDQPHLPTAQLPPHVPHMHRPPQWAQQPQQPGSVFVAPPVRRRSRVGLAVAGVVAAIGLSAVSAFGGGLAALELRPDKSNTVVGATNSSGSGATTTLSDVAAQVLPSVVSISTGNAVGSGVVITADGAILTNNHVVATARGTTVQVTFSSGQSVQAKIIGTEPSSDLAVIKIVGGGTYTPLAFGDSSTVKVGDTVLAVGSPLGLDGSVTAGIVSAVNRTIDEGEDGQSSAAKIGGAIQTDAAINPGNSGGALVNTAGQLVGINTAIATSGETAGNIGVGFAISSNTAKTVAQRLLS